MTAQDARVETFKGSVVHALSRMTQVQLDLERKRDDGPMDDVSKAITPGGRIGDASNLAKPGYTGPRRTVKYVRMIAHALMRKGMSKGRAIGMARGILKRWARGQGNIQPKVRAAALKALAEQAALDKKNRLSKSEMTTWNFEDYQLILAQLEQEGI